MDSRLRGSDERMERPYLPQKTVIPANAGIQSAVPHTPHVMSIKPENFDTLMTYVDATDIYKST